MKTKTKILTALLASVLLAEPQHKLQADVFDDIGLSNDFADISIMARPRFEFREIDGLEGSEAFTFRVRPSIMLGKGGPISLFADVEIIEALLDDYQSNPLGGPQTEPFNAGYTPIGDPEFQELNQLWAKFDLVEGFSAKVGRQRIARNNAAFIGNVPWRQGEQTFDAVELAYTLDEDFSITYAYADRVQRIFGPTTPRDLPLEEFLGEFHFIDATIPTPIGKVATYIYNIDVNNPGAGPLANVGESTTFGGSTTQGSLYLEAAFQDGESALEGGDYDAVYGHAKYTKKVDKTAFFGGLEYWSEGFKTPLATVHLYNGFADSVILQRIGLNDKGGVFEGMFNPYIGFSTPLAGGFVLKGFFHHLSDESLDKCYGNEFDVVLVKKLNDYSTMLLKGAYFMGDEYADITQFSAQIDFKF
ncbi:MAG: hypothetical protein CBC36_06230 [Verrucomicrobiaceae bacterium TMED76]|nr:MAG: hypothetical protein CBC36_06230 [Verrucomicrobiaceae bacterium TMED76]